MRCFALMVLGLLMFAIPAVGCGRAAPDKPSVKQSRSPSEFDRTPVPRIDPKNP